MNAAQEALHLREETPEPETPSQRLLWPETGWSCPACAPPPRWRSVNGDGSLGAAGGKDENDRKARAGAAHRGTAPAEEAGGCA